MKLMAQRGGDRWHVLVPWHMHVRAPDRIYETTGGACGRATGGETRPARTVPERHRCRSTACRRLWPAALRSVG